MDLHVEGMLFVICAKQMEALSLAGVNVDPFRSAVDEFCEKWLHLVKCVSFSTN